MPTDLEKLLDDLSRRRDEGSRRDAAVDAEDRKTTAELRVRVASGPKRHDDYADPDADTIRRHR